MAHTQETADTYPLLDIKSSNQHERLPSLKPSSSVESCKDDLPFELSPRLSPVRQTGRPSDAYGQARATQMFAFIGLGLTVIFGLFMLIFGIFIAVHPHSVRVDLPDFQYFVTKGAWALGVTTYLPTALTPTGNQNEYKALSFMMNFLVTMCTGSIGVLHSKSVQFAMAAEGRLVSNTTPRFLVAARRHVLWNPNGPVFTFIMALMLILSYASATLIFAYADGQTWINVNDDVAVYYVGSMLGVPTAVLGATLLIQAIITIVAVRSSKILTWSSSPLHVAAAMLRSGNIERVPGRCMHSIVDVQDIEPRMPQKHQPSALQAARPVRLILLAVWLLVPTYLIVGVVIWTTHLPDGLWALQTPNITPLNSLRDNPNPNSGSGIIFWLRIFGLYILLQGFLTLALYCSELVTGLIHDERTWRQAGTSGGLRNPPNAVLMYLRNWPNLILFAGKAVLHWMFGLALSPASEFEPADGDLFSNTPASLYAPDLSLFVEGRKILELAGGVLAFAIIQTIIANLRPRGPQPAAYGHLQTLVDLVDEWPGSTDDPSGDKYDNGLTMWWGHKQEGLDFCHAGTSNRPLPPVLMDKLYSGI